MLYYNFIQFLWSLVPHSLAIRAGQVMELIRCTRWQQLCVSSALEVFIFYYSSFLPFCAYLLTQNIR